MRMNGKKSSSLQRVAHDNPDLSPALLFATFLLVIAIVLVACGGGGAGTGGTLPEPEPDPSPGGTPNCIDQGYPCTTGEVDPSIVELEGEYVDALMQRLATQTYEQALEWISSQPGVAEAEAHASSLVFRLNGNQPTFIVGTAADDPDASLVRQAEGPAASSSSSSWLAYPQSVVGEGTDREARQNRKQALFLEPFQRAFGDRFAQHAAELKQIPDYGHDVLDVLRIINAAAGPEAFMGWDEYDAIFVSTHGGQSSKNTFIATGIARPYDANTDDFGEVCAEVRQGYEDLMGAKCGIVEEDGEEQVVLGLLGEFFQDRYGQDGGLDKAIVYMGGCLTLAHNWDVADALSGNSSAYFGWDGSVFTDKHPLAIDALLFKLIVRGTTAKNALDSACLADQCGGPSWGPGEGANLRIYDNGSEPKELRLYDVASLNEQGNPMTRLSDGDAVSVIGTPGDRDPDQLEIVAEFIGIVDPADTSGDIGTVQVDDVAELYDFAFFVDGVDIGADNLGNPRNESATTVQLGEGTYRYSYTADLPFDVPEDGMSVTLKIEVQLPEGGISDYEVDVDLGGVGWHMNVSGPDGGTYSGDVANATWLSAGESVSLTIATEASLDSAEAYVTGSLLSEPVAVFSEGTISLNPSNPGFIVVSLGNDAREWRAGNGTSTALIGCDLREWTEPPLPSITFSATSDTKVTGFVEGQFYRLKTIGCTDPNGQEFPGVEPVLADLRLDFTADRAP